MQRRRFIVTPFLVAGIVAVSTVAAVSAHRIASPEASPPAPPTVVPDISHPGDLGLHELTAKEIDLAVKIATDDPRLAEAAGGAELQVTRTGGWHEKLAGTSASPSSYKFIGVVMTVELSEPVNVTRDWPGVIHEPDPQSGTLYTEGSFRAAVTGLRSLDVLVDLERQRVVNIAPYEADSKAPIDES